MKKRNLVMGVIGAVGLVIALMTFGLGASTAVFFDSNGANLMPRKSSYWQHTVTEYVNAVEVTSSDGSVIIKEGDEFAVEAFYNSEPPTVTVRDNVLIVDFKSRQQFNFNIGIIMDNRQSVTITVPNEMLEHLKVNGENGRVIVERASAKDTSIRNDNGSIKLEQLHGDALNVRCDNGSITLTDVDVNSVDITNHNGSINVDRLNGEVLSARNDNGRIVVMDVDARYVNATNHNGSIRFENVTGRITARNDNGSMRFLRMRGEYYLDLRTGNGSIRVNGERERSRFTVGDSSLENAIIAENNNGSITVEF